MPGPRAGYLGIYEYTDSRSIHSKCQQGADCTGPGCRIFTGKTQKKVARANLRRPRNAAEIFERYPS